MKNILFITALTLTVGFLTSCSEDINVEPNQYESATETTSPSKSEYSIQIQVQTSLDAPDHNDEASYNRTLKLVGKGVGTSQTFGDVDTRSELYYGLDDGKLFGTIHIKLNSSSQDLVLRIDEKIEGSAWEDLEHTCLSAMSSQKFAEMDFNGQICMTDLPDHLVEIGSQQVTFEIAGTLK